MKKHFYLIIFLLAQFTVFSQTTVSFSPEKDNTLYEENNNSNGVGDYLFSGVTASGNKRRSLIKFNLTTIPQGATITSVTLNLSCNRKGSAGGGINVNKLTADWGEGTSNANSQEGAGATATNNDATWTKSFNPSTAWTTAGGDFVATASVSTASNVELGPVILTGNSGSALVSDVQGFVSISATNFGWIITGTNESRSGSSLRFTSGNNSTTADRPTLSITYTTSLPVTLSKFNATLQQGNALLQWQTATEVNNKLFEIEHSTNGVNFAAIGTINGRGNSSVQQNYSYLHRSVAKGKNYYRLAQYDLNGTRKYSPVILLNASGKTSFSVFPNPAKNVLQINASFLDANTRYRIVNMTGQVFTTGVLNNQQVNISNLPAGQYSLSILSATGEWYKSTFLVKK